MRLNRFKKIWIALTIICSLTLCTSSVFADELPNCVPAEVLINSPAFKENKIVICDSLTNFYLLGLGYFDGDDAPAFDIELNLRELEYEDRFYGFARSYMAKKNRKLDDAKVDLLLMNAFLSQSPHNVQSIRHKLYRNYFTMEMVKLILDEVSYFQAGALRNSIAYPEREFTPEVRARILCFVKHDIPSSEIEEIISSKQYTNCLAG